MKGGMDVGGRPAGPAPRLVAWETTRRCPMKCKHCRGSARNQDYAGELSPAETRLLIDNIASFSKPILILTGGEPMTREDIYDIARYGTDKGLRVVMSPCGPLITPETASKMKESGIQRISVSIDGATAATHDEFRGVPGAFDGALRGIGHARDAGMEFQINTTVTKHNISELADILALAERLGAVAFNPFLLVPTGRGKAISDLEIPPGEYERALNWVYEKSLETDIQFKPTCAPHYHRIFRQREEKAGREVTPKSHGLFAMTKGCMGGDGFVFVSYDGLLQPCGFFDVNCGELRRENFDFKKIYETSKVFNELRDTRTYKGKCGVCEYVKVCGGCRARALELSGDYLAEEPFCVYTPKSMRRGDG
ncbi:MAG: Antilisterial bacteriocin subtilosin biosynthesis protein AlbA [bacterium ADurb.Bin236]|nr:MAG: Antilisterial bacteriocin subtilosin biosynthesis protein AlbA [bacterium ADurb.Bin236]HOY61891.1 heme b synthase [bacterium]HPN95837.1 heme b synthase [bacterium]